MQAKAVRLRASEWLAGVLVIAAGTAAGAQDDGPALNPRRGLTTELQRHFDKARKVDAPFHPPDEAPYRGQFELRLNVGTFKNPAAVRVDQRFPTSFQLLCYNQSRVGPTLRVKRGTTFRIHLKNDLDPHWPDPGENPNDIGLAWEAYHGLCTTNLHTHGLHVSPRDPADNVLLAIEPGSDRYFEYTIDKRHPSGTFWYHPHKHGSVAYQLSNGVSGALIVEGSPDDDILDLDEIPEIAAAKERILVMQWYTFITGPDHVGRIDAKSIYNVCPTLEPLRTCPSIPAYFDPQAPQALNALAINGIVNPTIEIAPGAVERWRIIHAGWDVAQELSMVDDRQQPIPGFVFQEIAVDGLATGSMTPRKCLEIAPGQRSDVLVKAPKTPGTYHLRSSSPDAGSSNPPISIAKIQVRGTPHDMHLPNRNALVNCNPFIGKEIGDGSLVRPTISNGMLEFAAQDPKESKPKRPYFYTINYSTFHKQQVEPILLTLNTAQEWTITSRKSAHPFHIHVNPFYVVSYTTPCKKDKDGKLIPTPVGLWRDTLYVREGESYKIRSRFEDYTGDSVLHCHILDHEDQGMMMRIRLIDPRDPARDQRALGLKDASKPAPGLELRDPKGANHTLAEFSGRRVVLVFFQGAECFHCTQQLRDLVRAARGKIDDDVEIVAVSSRRIANPARALKSLDLGDFDKLHFLVDESHGSFRDFGCFDGQPRHGLFLIDPDGIIRASYVGESPFNDAAEVVRRIKNVPRSGAG